MDTRTTATFRALHERGRTFVMPNAWDAGTAILLAGAGFEAIATTSAGIAFSMGRPDHVIPEGGRRVDRSAMFERMREIAEAVALPVNGDLEDGYGPDPEDVAGTIRDAIAIGLAGGNIEDHAPGGLYDRDRAVQRVAAAVEAARASGFVVTARTDGLLLDPTRPLSDAIERANRYREAGADCLYVPGVNDLQVIETLVQEIEGPLNVVVGLGGGGLTVSSLRDRGVVRISLGGTIARAALGLVRDSARELLERGTLEFAEGQFSQSELNAVFAEGA
ncbi:MAG: isocitrate lyase/PEP mutase family protein [Candidatus Dormibacteraceae bacterium]